RREDERAHALLRRAARGAGVGEGRARVLPGPLGPAGPSSPPQPANASTTSATPCRTPALTAP
ncbi:MAG: hypothetical protein CMH59_22780, partial [Myxococcales bacterium]|nr:hypothetical protein [Myxococcales bacterium]